jgi:hypothetical protein
VLLGLTGWLAVDRQLKPQAPVLKDDYVACPKEALSTTGKRPRTHSARIQGIWKTPSLPPNCAPILALLERTPLTRKELAELAGFHQYAITKIIQLLNAEGLRCRHWLAMAAS